MAKSLHNAKILPHEALEIRLRVQSGQSTPTQEADRFHVGVETIRRIVRRETHRFVEEVEIPVGNVPKRRVTDQIPADLLEIEARESKERFIAGQTPQEDAVEFFLEKRLVPRNPLDEASPAEPGVEPLGPRPHNQGEKK